MVNRLASDIRRAGYEVLLDDETPDSWADSMYAALGPELGDRCFRALSRILHPDVTGGDHLPMAALNAARDRARS